MLDGDLAEPANLLSRVATPDKAVLWRPGMGAATP